MKPIEFTLKYGKGTISFEIPEEQLLYTIMGNDVNALPDLGEACQYALEHPIDSPPLREIVKQGEKVAIAVSDITRVWQKNDQILPVLIKTLNETGSRMKT